MGLYTTQRETLLEGKCSLRIVAAEAKSVKEKGSGEHLNKLCSFGRIKEKQKATERLSLQIQVQMCLRPGGSIIEAAVEDHNE